MPLSTVNEKINLLFLGREERLLNSEEGWDWRDAAMRKKRAVNQDSGNLILSLPAVCL